MSVDIDQQRNNVNILRCRTVYVPGLFLTYGEQNEIRADQSAILEAALDRKPANELLTMEKSVEEKQVKFMTTKTACRDNLKKILTAGQWEQVVKIYKSENGLK